MDRVLAVAEICLSPLLVDIMRKEAWNTWGVTAEWGIVPDSLEVAMRTWKVPVQDKRSLRQIPNWTSFIGRSELPNPTEHACSAPQLRSVQLALSDSWASSFGNRHNNCVAHTSESTNRWLQTYWNVQISRQLRTPLMWLILENYLSWEKIAVFLVCCLVYSDWITAPAIYLLGKCRCSCKAEISQLGKVKVFEFKSKDFFVK